MRIHSYILTILFFASCSMKDESKTTLDGEWLFQIDSTDVGVKDRWFEPGRDMSEWKKVAVPEYWDRYNLETYDGVGWFAKSFEVKESKEAMALFFGGVDDDADVWLNGVKVGSHIGYSDAFSCDVSRALRAGINVLVVRVADHGGPGGIYRPVTLIPPSRVLELLKTKYADLPARKSEDWVRDAVIYEVYLRSFSKEGTFKGLERRLPELKKLGVTVLWLMPIHPVGLLNRKGRLGSPYAVQDYYEVNEEFGTLEDFRSLVNSVHDQGMEIIIDLVINHTAWDSKLMFEHPDWFTTNDEGAIVAPNADWHDVADLNYDHHELRKYMIEMMKYWVRDVGIDGYRCDVAELVPTDFWEVARRELDKIKPVMMLSEGTLPEHHVQAFDLTYSWNVYDVLGKVLDGTTPASIFDEILKTESYQFPKGSLRMRFNTNHDKNAWDAPAVKKFSDRGAKATAVLIFTYPGVPLIYNGEEVGNPKPLDLFDKVDIDWTKGKDFRAHYEKLTSLRREHEALRRGTYRMLPHNGGEKVYVFQRQSGTDRVITVINFSKQKAEIIADCEEATTWKMKEYFSGASATFTNGKLSVEVPPLGYKVFVPDL
ncbi:MAG TPA: alpha-amylase family glycosyl hydrolase [Bacteroidota bacterium]|nr:alpha-amylase family glycosyl hydrolase [Bacteroidota bacterium]